MDEFYFKLKRKYEELLAKKSKLTQYFDSRTEELNEMIHICKLCETEEEPNTWYSDNGVDDETEVICEFCYLNLRKTRDE